jgi:hypothetical protein
VQRFATATRTWSALPSLPEPRRYFGAAVDCMGRLYAVGGENFQGTMDLASVGRLDEDASVWQSAPTLNHTGGALAVVTGGDGVIYAIGGSVLGTATASVETLYP